LLRGIDRFFDLGELRTHLAPFYSQTGRPSIDPELMMRLAATAQNLRRMAKRLFEGQQSTALMPV
jgi:hypothetical protein